MSWRKSPPPQRFWEDEAYESWDFCENESSSSEQSKVLEALRLDGTSRGRQEQEVKVEGERHKRVVGGVEVTLVSPRRHIEMSVGGDAPDCAPRKIAKAKDDKKLKVRHLCIVLIDCPLIGTEETLSIQGRDNL
jgi:hypothetical protein